jgi:hypothetical protein
MRGKRAVSVTAVSGAVLLVAACGSGGGSTPTPTLPPTVAATAPPSAIPTTTPASTEPTSSPDPASTAPSWAPRPYGDAQPAVDALLRLSAAEAKAFGDPARIGSTEMDKYLIGDARTQYDTALAAEKSAGRFYKGTAPTQRIRVEDMNLSGTPKSVSLSSCALASKSDPFIEYLVATGKPASDTTAPPKVEPPYKTTFKIFLLSDRWLVETLSVDSSATCVP